MNTNTTRVHRFATGGSLMAGLALVFSATFPALPAQLLQTDQGSLATEVHAISRVSTLIQGTIHGAAMTPVLDPKHQEMQLLTGMLLILLGFALHALFLRRERRVPVHAALSHPHTRPTELEVFWMEKEIRM